jgi:hypothetical protein
MFHSHRHPELSLMYYRVTRCSHKKYFPPFEIFELAIRIAFVGPPTQILTWCSRRTPSLKVLTATLSRDIHATMAAVACPRITITILLHLSGQQIHPNCHIRHSQLVGRIMSAATQGASISSLQPSIYVTHIKYLIWNKCYLAEIPIN